MEALIDSDVRNKSLTRISMCNLALDSEWRIRKSFQLGSSMMRLFKLSTSSWLSMQTVQMTFRRIRLYKFRTFTVPTGQVPRRIRSPILL